MTEQQEMMSVKFAGALVALALVLGMFIGYVSGARLVMEDMGEMAKDALSSSSVDVELNFNETTIIDEMCKRIPECNPGDV